MWCSGSACPWQRVGAKVGAAPLLAVWLGSPKGLRAHWSQTALLEWGSLQAQWAGDFWNRSSVKKRLKNLQQCLRPKLDLALPAAFLWHQGLPTCPWLSSLCGGTRSSFQQGGALSGQGVASRDPSPCGVFPCWDVFRSCMVMCWCTTSESTASEMWKSGEGF